MKSLGKGASFSLRIAAATVFAVLLLLYSPAMAVDSYDFAEVPVGTQSSVGLEIQSLSPDTDLTFGFELASQGGAGFSLPTPELTIPAGGAAQLEVVFAPTTLGLCEDTLNVNFTNEYGTFLIQQIPLSGTGIEQPSSAEPAAEPAGEPDPQASEENWPKRLSRIAGIPYKGKTVEEHVQECMASADKHGQAVRCVAYLAADLRKEHLISRHEAKDMRHFAAKSKHHHKAKKHKIKKHEAKKHEAKWESRLEKKAHVR